ncbi:MAG: excinuclease ABC subunit UvrB [Candidatus Taylorbacteria bacterium]|nr:excinuclease ABC subunit UvrB [Candidatus Taylorbacteria bacterium]
MEKFKLKSHFAPAGDQPRAIVELVESLKKGYKHQTLLGVTGSGKTFTAANVIASVQKPTLVIAHNKTLAAQLAQEYKEFFPDNAVHYFVSYYDYYQPEAYMPVTDTYIEKEAVINEEIDRLRHASTQALLTRRDTIIVASVSCIYGLGSPEEYQKVNVKIEKGQAISRGELMRGLIRIHYERTTADLSPGLFRAVGDAVEVMPVSERVLYRLEFEREAVARLAKVDAVSRKILGEPDAVFIFPAKHFITPEEDRVRAIKTIKLELKDRLKTFEKEKKLLEAERLKRRTNYDLAMIREIGYCNGIENYSRHFSGKLPGEPPDTLLSYFQQGRGLTQIHSNPRISADGNPRESAFLTVIDESHVTVPQLRGMYVGDKSRKDTLIEHGFRLPSARDNRPLKFNEFEALVGQALYTSATPGPYELEKSGSSTRSADDLRQSASSSRKSAALVEQVIRPTGLVDPQILVRPISDTGERSDLSGRTLYQGQVFDFIAEAEKVIKNGERAMATTLTKKMAEDLSLFLKDKGLKAEYLHSDIKTIERIEILTQFRKGQFDCLVGVNLLREGLDLPEVALIGILDADKEGFLRSETSLIQIIGRAARNVNGRVILYADTMTGSIERAVGETNRRRALQLAYNKKHGITPKTIVKKIRDITEELDSHKKAVRELVKIDLAVPAKNRAKLIRDKERQMNAAVKILDFETAALLRDEIKELKKLVASSKIGLK